jgi:hypothetical protein
MTRTVLTVIHRDANDRWHLEEGVRLISTHITKYEAVEAGKHYAQRLVADGAEAALVVYRLDGRPDTELLF